jgi:hypothetical protein
MSARQQANRLWSWAKRPDVPKRAGGPASPVAVTETDVSVLTAAEYPELPEIQARPGDTEIHEQIERIGAGIDAGTASALDELLYARERGWLADLDSRRASHQSWVDAIAADGLYRKVRLDEELLEVQREIATLDLVMADASAQLRTPTPQSARSGRRLTRRSR